MKKNSIIVFLVSLMLLGDAIFLYYLMGGFEQIGFPARQVLLSLPIAFVVWAISAATDPKTYCSIFDFLGCMIFGTTIFTATFIMFGGK